MNPTRTGLVPNLGFHDKRLVTNCPSLGTNCLSYGTKMQDK